VGQPARVFEEYDQSCRARPILKWAGGKQQLLDALLERLPSSFGRYVEPMVGGGALFFGLAPRRGAPSVAAATPAQHERIYLRHNSDRFVSVPTATGGERTFRRPPEALEVECRSRKRTDHR
jgi:hypothetical protein